MLQRGGEVVIRMLENVKQVTIGPLIERTIARGTPIYTDEYDIDSRLAEWGYGHETVCHAAGEFARDDDGRLGPISSEQYRLLRAQRDEFPRRDEDVQGFLRKRPASDQEGLSQVVERRIGAIPQQITELRSACRHCRPHREHGDHGRRPLPEESNRALSKALHAQAADQRHDEPSSGTLIVAHGIRVHDATLTLI